MATDSGSFSGFGPDAIGFLAGLDADNTKSYFHDHQAIYHQQVRAPLKQLCLAVGELLADEVAPHIQFEAKVGRSMFRINRDLRFSKDKTPYHPHLDRFRRAVVGPPGQKLASIVESLAVAVPGASLSEPWRKRVPRGFDADHPRARFLLFDGLHMSSGVPVPATITTAQFAPWVADHLAPYAQLHRWLVDHT